MERSESAPASKTAPEGPPEPFVLAEKPHDGGGTAATDILTERVDGGGSGTATEVVTPVAKSVGTDPVLRWPARPRDALVALMVLAAGLGVGVAGIAGLGPAVQVLDGPALTAPDGRPRAVTALQWDGAGLLSIGTEGAGLVTWDAATGELRPDAVPGRQGRTVLSLPALPPGVAFAERPVVTMWTEAVEGAWEEDNRALAGFVKGRQGWFPVLTFRRDEGDAVVNHVVGDRVLVGEEAVLTDLAVVGPDFPGRRIALQGKQNAVDVEPDGGSWATIGSNVREDVGIVALVGDSQGMVTRVYLDDPAGDGLNRPNLLLPFMFERDEFSVRRSPAAITAIAAADDEEQVAAADTDGRIGILRRDGSAPTAQQLPRAMSETQEVGLAPPELWIEPVLFESGGQAVNDAVALGFSASGREITILERGGSYIVGQKSVGGGGEAAIPTIADGGEQPPDFTNSLVAVSPLIANLPLVSGAALLALSNAADMTTLAEAVTAAETGVAGDLPAQPSLREALPWQLPLNLPDIGEWIGSAIDPDTGRGVVWGIGGEVHLLMPGVEELGPDLGDGTAVADAAFEPVTGALVVLAPDGTAQRFPLDSERPSIWTFEVPAATPDAPALRALQISFPPDELSTLVLWGNPDMPPDYTLRRYDRATGQPLDEGVDAGTADLVLPDRSGLVMSAENGEELVIRDARTGRRILDVLFEGGTVRLTPTPSGREIGTVQRSSEMWTLRLAPPEGGPRPPVPAELAATFRDEIAVPPPGGVAPDGLSLSGNGDTLLVRSRTGQMYVARPAFIPERDSDLPCCIPLRRVLPGVVATHAVLTGGGGVALVAGADHTIWRVDLDSGAATPLVHLAGPVRTMALSPDGAHLAVAADGAPPVVLRVARATWAAGLPLVGQVPFAKRPPLGLRYLPDAGLPDEADADVILLAVFATQREAEILQAQFGAAGRAARILRKGGRYLVTLEREGEDGLSLRRELALARGIAPASRGAVPHRIDLLCDGVLATPLAQTDVLKCDPQFAAPGGQEN